MPFNYAGAAPSRSYRPSARPGRLQTVLDRDSPRGMYAWVSLTNGQLGFVRPRTPDDLWHPKYSQKAGYMLRQVGMAGVIFWPSPKQRDFPFEDVFMEQATAFMQGFHDNQDVLIDPEIKMGPQDVIRSLASSATFGVTIKPSQSAEYMWQHYDGTAWQDIQGATSANYTIPSAGAQHVGHYRVRVTGGNPTWIQYSKAAELSITGWPLLTQQPWSRSICNGGIAFFSVKADVTDPDLSMGQERFSAVQRRPCLRCYHEHSDNHGCRR